ncbi:MAG: hypothetical protein ABJA66_03175 [Actinomycetota bacterium]
MKVPKIAVIFLCTILLMPHFAVFAFETDQYNLPPVPLADIGEEVSDYVEGNLRKAINKLNAEIAVHQSCLELNSKKTGCNSAEQERAELAGLRSEEAMAREVFKPLGGGIPPFTNSDSWMKSHKFKAQPARYKTSFGKSIYRTFPSNYLTISETVNLFGREFGIDKIAHIFQQGYTYYRMVEDAQEKKLSSAEALRKAVNWGRITEKTYYGFWVSGVYSNADLAANFIGLKFYQGLTREITINGQTRPPILILKDGIWKFNENVNLRESLLKPLISNHLSEAYNPSIYANFFGFRAAVRGTVKKQACPQWRKLYPNYSAADFDKITADLRLWYGADYGSKDSPNFITIANTCF